MLEITCNKDEHLLTNHGYYWIYTISRTLRYANRWFKDEIEAMKDFKEFRIRHNKSKRAKKEGRISLNG